jgi:hypothetical protein
VSNSNSTKAGIDDFTPQQLGHAAAYEAYRYWLHNPSLYGPFQDDFERQREGLIGLAVAEGVFVDS